MKKEKKSKPHRKQKHKNCGNIMKIILK